MRIYVSVDMEGIAGIVHEDQTNPVEPRCAAEYARGRKLMTAEGMPPWRAPWLREQITSS